MLLYHAWKKFGARLNRGALFFYGDYMCWISIKDRLPQIENPVNQPQYLTYSPPTNSVYLTSLNPAYYTKKEGFSISGEGCGSESKITHWMYIQFPSNI